MTEPYPVSSTPALTADVTGAPPAPVVWPPEKLRQCLVCDDPGQRFEALLMTTHPGAPVDDCIGEIVRCALLAKEDSMILQHVPIALGSATATKVNQNALEMLSALLDIRFADHVRIFAAHALFRLKMVPESAFERLSVLLVHTNPSARKIALFTLILVIKPATNAITKLVAALPPDQWTDEALAALARSAGDSTEHKRVVEQYVMRSLPSAPIVPTGIAGYTALAQMQPGGPATVVLGRIASTATEPEHWKAALAALTTLGDAAQSAAPELGKALALIDDPEREESMCRAMVSIRAKENDVPLARVVQRIQSGPEHSATAHCMLLCLHPKRFAPAAKIVAERYAGAGDALKAALAQTHKTLVGTLPGGMAAQRS